MAESFFVWVAARKIVTHSERATLVSLPRGEGEGLPKVLKSPETAQTGGTHEHSHGIHWHGAYLAGACAGRQYLAVEALLTDSQADAALESSRNGGLVALI